MFQSFFFLFSYIGAVLVFLLLKKSEEKQYIGMWLGISIMSISCLQVMIAGLFSLMHIPVNIVSLGICNTVFLLISGWLIYKSKSVQRYIIEWCDIIFVIGVTLVVLLFWYKHYGTEFNIHYLSVDPTAHFRHALYTVNNESVYGMFFAAIQNSILIELFSPILTPGTYYVAYIIGDVLYLWLAGIMFWAVIRKYMTNQFMKIAAVIVSFLYLFGYPLNVTIFGFSYFGLGITVIAYIIAVTEEYLEDSIPKKLSVFLMSLGCFGIFVSYVMFMPVVFFAVLLVILIKQYSQKKLISWETVRVGLGVFLIPTIMGLYYIYSGTFINGHTAESTIVIEGGVYRDIFSNFILIFPFALYAFIKMIKEKKNSVILAITLLQVLFTVGMFVMVMKQKSSSYYFFKNHYLLWLLGLLLAYFCLQYLDKVAKTIVAIGVALWGTMVSLWVFGLEYAVQNKVPLMVLTPKAGILSDIYVFNRDAMCIPEYSKEITELYTYVCDNILSYNDCEVPVAGTWEDYMWMTAVTNHDNSPIYWLWSVGDESFIGALKESANYVIVLYDRDVYSNNKEYFESLEKVYCNGAGYIAVIK